RPPAALRVEQRGEAAVIDARGRGFRHAGLGAISDPEPRRLDHGGVVCPIAGDESGLWRDAEPPREGRVRGAASRAAGPARPPPPPPPPPGTPPPPSPGGPPRRYRR